jgi:hypothetical protein
MKKGKEFEGDIVARSFHIISAEDEIIMVLSSKKDTARICEDQFAEAPVARCLQT